MSEVFPWDELPQAHLKMLRNEHKPGNMACWCRPRARVGDPAAADARIGRRSIRKNRGFPGKPGVSVEILNPRLNKPQVSTACHP
jgi:hypothetical protein